MRKIKLTLNPKSIDNAIRELEQYKRELKQRVNELVEALTDYGVEIAKVQIREFDAVYTGELESSIVGYFSPTWGVGIIKAGAPYAVYVEFGTGVVGKDFPHPEPDGWKYDVNNHGEAGWWYFNDRDGKWHWTTGMESRPFMYHTARILEQECSRIAKEVFGK